ncbi:hypothetical protein KI688_012684 [Linnemannia hyalina]|uniref:F-box domain-containing protein n=1 Tax=Linnemannia hyalina TaxID=64524 RepID=A0A9P8BT16_9FUNG|nr:hypothetical protein KI688_012684 [Linnemannia hyalina]
MSETTPPPLPTQSSNSRSPEKTPLTKDSALEVTQVLEMIFSNLTSHQIRQSYLGVAQRLVIRADRREPASGTPFEWKSSFSPASWQALLGAITDTPYLLNLLDLQVLCPIDFALEAFELLRHIGSLLTKLRLEVSRRDFTLLDTTLSLCPKLEQLTVEFSCSEEDFIEELYSKPWSPPVSQAIPLAHPSLRSLTLRRVAVDEESLLSLVDMCPELEDLVLDQVFVVIDNEVEMRDVQATILPLFPEATAWVFPATSVLEVAEICGWSNSFFDLPRVTMLTSLEILAPGVMIPLDCLDMEGVLGSNGAYRKPDPTPWSLMPDDVLGNSRTMILGCRNLPHELSSRQSNELTKIIDQSIAEEVFNPIYRHYPLDYQAPAAPGTPSLQHTNVAFVRGREANAGDHGRDGWGHGTDASVSAGVGTVQNYVIDGIDMRYLGQLQGVVEVCKHRISSGNTTWWTRMEYLEIAKKERLPDVFVGTAVRAQHLVCQMRPDIEFNAFWR